MNFYSLLTFDFACSCTIFFNKLKTIIDYLRVMCTSYLIILYKYMYYGYCETIVKLCQTINISE